jgi:uncharacterized membrane protein
VPRLHPLERCRGRAGAGGFCDHRGVDTRHVPHEDPEVPFDVERLVFFSDAVFAIAITLLVIDLGVPDSLPSDAALREALVDLVPSLFSFFLSFAVIALYWLSHHRLIRVLERSHPLIIGLNFVLLASIAFLPFTSGVLGHHGNLPTAVMLYAGTNLVASLAVTLMRVIALRARLLKANVNVPAFRRRTVYPAVTAGIFLLSMLVAPVSPTLATQAWILVFVTVLIRSWDERRRHGHDQAHASA